MFRLDRVGQHLISKLKMGIELSACFLEFCAGFLERGTCPTGVNGIIVVRDMRYIGI